MSCQSYVRALMLIVALTAAGDAVRFAGQSSNQSQTQGDITIHLRWGPRPGVYRYRLQLARDRGFADIVFDRVIAGNEVAIDELSPGRYFWRIAPLTTKLGEFSSATPIDVNQPGPQATPRATPKVDERIKPKTVPAKIFTGGGWRAAVGETNSLVLAHLRSPGDFDVVGTNSDGVTFALEADTGVALWTVRPPKLSARSASVVTAPLIIPSRLRLDNVLILADATIIEVDGATGRELWRAQLPASAGAGAVIGDQSGPEIVVLDTSFQRLFILNGVDGRLILQSRLTARAVGAPQASAEQDGTFAIAYDTGALEIRDRTGGVIRSGSTGSPATTPPVFVRGSRGNLVLVGTRDGLTALTAEDLRPLGRVALKNDAPRGMLMTQDLDGDGVAEVIMITARRHIVVVKATDGRIVWDAVADEAEAFAFGDVNGDGVPDVLMTAGQVFAVALSGRDGAMLWQDAEPAALVANHTNGFVPRAMIAMPNSSGTLLIGSDQSHTGLRAIVFSKAAIRPDQR